MSASWVQVQGSTPHRPAGAARTDEIDPDQQLTVTFAVRGRDLAGLDAPRHHSLAHRADRAGSGGRELAVY